MPDGDINGAGDMGHFKLVLRANVENGDGALLHTLKKFPSRHRLHAVALSEVTGNDLLNFGDMPLAREPQGGQKFDDGIVTESANQILPLLARVHQTCGPEPLQVLRGVGQGQSRRWARTSTLLSP